MVPNYFPDHDALTHVDIQDDHPRSNFKVDLFRSLSAILYLMISGDLNIGLMQKKVIKVVGLTTNYQTLIPVCRYDS